MTNSGNIVESFFVIYKTGIDQYLSGSESSLTCHFSRCFCVLVFSSGSNYWQQVKENMDLDLI